MNRKQTNLPVFIGAAVLSAALYGLTRPEGLPWRVPVYWGGTWLVAAFLAGGVGWLVSREFGWRVGLAAAIVWIFTPGIWNRAILGSALVLLFPLGVLALWGAYWLVRDIGRQMAVGTPRPPMGTKVKGANRKAILPSAVLPFVRVSSSFDPLSRRRKCPLLGSQ